MNAPQLPPVSSFSKASVSETSPRTLSENVEFSPNLSPNLFVYFSSFLLLLLFLFLCLLLKRKCLWSAWFRWLILPLKAVASSPERVETASRVAAAVDCEKKNEKRKKKKKTWWWCYYSPLLLLFKRAKRTHKSAFVFGCVVLSKLSLSDENGKKSEEKFRSSSKMSLLMKSSQRARTRNFCGYCASSFPSKKAIIRAHNTCDALRGIKTYSSLSLSLSKLFYFIHKIIILLRFPTSQRFHDALRGRWPRRFLIRSEHIPNRWDAHR